jgi:PAS domain S-box-containing protein
MSTQLPRNDAILASARCGMAVVTPQGEWLAANPALCRLLGEPVDSLLGQPAHRRLFPDNAARIDAALRELSGGVAMRLGLDVDYTLPSGAALRLELDADLLPAAVGQPPCLLLQVHDATAAHRAQQTLDAMSRQQEQLDFGISHDLRASLRSIEGFAGQLSQQPLDAQGREHLDRVRAAAAQAGGLVDALLQLSRAATQPLVEAEVDLGLLAEWVLADLQAADPTREVAIDIQPGLQVRGDERLLKRALEQLLHNAWKFSADRRPATIAIEARPAPPGRRVVCIRDNGAGFDMRYVDKLFNPFRRLHGVDSGGGPGLGLAIVRAIVQRHGGRVWAESQPGAGSKFFVELPASNAESES